MLPLGKGGVGEWGDASDSETRMGPGASSGLRVGVHPRP